MSAGLDFKGLRVGLIGPVPPPAGGMAMQTQQLARLLQEAGAHVTLQPTNPPYRPAWVAQWRGLRAVARLLGYLGALWRLGRQSDVFHLMANSGWSWHLFAAPALLIGRWRRVPVVVNYRGGGAGEFLTRNARSVRAGMRRAAALIVPSGFLVEVFSRHGMPAEVVPNIIDLSRFRARPVRAGQGAHLIVTRHLEALYDNATAVRALALLRQQLPQARLTLAGSGPEEAALRALVAELGLQDAVHFAGTLDREGVARLYGEADLMLNPSRADNMPNSVLEAMASGVPVVSTSVGGVPFLIQDGRTGLLVPVGDAAAMAAAALRVLSEPGLWPALHLAGLQDVQQYTWPRVAQRLLTTYRRVGALT
jgi:glycosyltransferase involved in cell wall biosynthesis